jgi:hypothetical protein
MRDTDWYTLMIYMLIWISATLAHFTVESLFDYPIAVEMDDTKVNLESSILAIIMNYSCTRIRKPKDSLFKIKLRLILSY